MSFGLSKIDAPGPAEMLARELPDPVRDGTLLQLLLYQEYDKHYGLFDYDDPNAERQRPLAAVALHEKEKFTPHARLRLAQERFIKYKIFHHTGLSFTQFHDQPRDIVEYWYELAIAETERAGRSDTAAINALQGVEREIGKV